MVSFRYGEPNGRLRGFTNCMTARKELAFFVVILPHVPPFSEGGDPLSSESCIASSNRANGRLATR